MELVGAQAFLELGAEHVFIFILFFW